MEKRKWEDEIEPDGRSTVPVTTRGVARSGQFGKERRGTSVFVGEDNRDERKRPHGKRRREQEEEGARKRGNKREGRSQIRNRIPPNT